MESALSILLSKYIHKLNNEIGLIRTTIKFIQYARANLLKEDEFLANSLEKIEDTAAGVLSSTDEIKLSFNSPEEVGLVSVPDILSKALEEIDAPKSVNVKLEIEKSAQEARATNSLLDVFRNLIINALEAMPNGGELKIESRINETENQIEIIFTDTGRGIPSYILESLFEPYFSTKKQKGHGLGLWWCKSYLEKINGNIELLWSEVGKGSSFMVTLPLHE